MQLLQKFPRKINMITIEQLQKILPLNKECVIWVDLLNQYLPKYEINTKDRLVMFLAQTSHESSQYTVLKENLFYSSQGLLKVFPKYFNEKQAEQYAKKPIMIASRVYANRMGNGDEASQDGWKYSGKGIIQLTGKSTVSEFSTSINKTLDETCEYLLTKDGALQSVLYYWNKNKLNISADSKDITSNTKKINGGIIGLQARIDEYNRISNILV